MTARADAPQSASRTKTAPTPSAAFSGVPVVPTVPSVPAGPRVQGAGQRVRTWVAILWGAAGAIVLFLVAVGVGLYAVRWTSPVIAETARLLPYPVAAVNARPTTYRTFRSDVATLIHYYTKQNELNPTLFPVPPEETIEAIVLTKLVKDSMTEQLARREDIVVSDADVEAEYTKVSEQSGNPEGIEENIRELYNWDIPTFKVKVIRPFLIRSKLQERLSANETENQEAKTLAEAVLARVKNGTETFEDIAKQFSQDEATAESGGDLGFFGPGEMVESFEQAVAALEVGEVSNLVQTPFGYHLIKLEEKADSADGQPTYRARHILIKTKTVDALVNEELGKGNVWILLGGYQWDSAQSVVVPDSVATAQPESTEASGEDPLSGSNAGTGSAGNTNTTSTE